MYQVASTTRSSRSVLVHAGRLTCRLMIINCWRRSAFSATSSDLVLARSIIVPTRREVLVGLVQSTKRCWSVKAYVSNRLMSEDTLHNYHSFFEDQQIHAWQFYSPSAESARATDVGKCSQRPHLANRYHKLSRRLARYHLATALSSRPSPNEVWR